MEKRIRFTIGIAAGKGGVGKTTVTVGLALALSEMGYAVGVLDADVYGPSLEKVLPCDIPPRKEKNLLPAEGFGLKMISPAHFRKEGEAAIVRAPVANGLIQQFLQDVDWGDLDFLLIDFPPGTGDIQLTLLQEGQLSAAIGVTTPQEVALIDVKGALSMFEQMGVPLLGVVENMSYLDVGGQRITPFGSGGATKLGLPVLAQLPIDPAISSAMDRGEKISNECFSKLAVKVRDHLIEIEGEREYALPIDLKPVELQKQCPCAKCREGKPRVDEDVQILSFEAVGRYAIRFSFSSGCSRGIYSHSALSVLQRT